MRRLRIWTLMTHAAVAIVVFTISNLRSGAKSKGCIHTQDTPQSHWAPEVVPTEMKEPSDLLQVYDGVKAYLLFIGHSRSGHSIVGALLDAHPEVLISQEQGSGWALWTSKEMNPVRRNRMKYRFFLEIQHNSQREALLGRRAIVAGLDEGNSTYLYHVHGQWQGQFRDKLKVMGDKAAHFTSEFFKNPEHLVKLDYLKKNLGVSLKIIHVLRNPYDNIATQTLRHDDPRGRDSASPQNKMNKPEAVDRFIRGYFARTEANERIRKKHDVLDILGHELMQRPKESIQKMCNYVGITCEEDYIDACAKQLQRKPSITRNFIEWTDEQKRLVQREIEKYSFLSRYNFKSYP